MGDERKSAAGVRRFYDGAGRGGDVLQASIVQGVAYALCITVGLHEVHEVIFNARLAAALRQDLARAREAVASGHERGVHRADVLGLPATRGVRDGRQVTWPGTRAEAQHVAHLPFPAGAHLDGGQHEHAVRGGQALDLLDGIQALMVGDGDQREPLAGHVVEELGAGPAPVAERRVHLEIDGGLGRERQRGKGHVGRHAYLLRERDCACVRWGSPLSVSCGFVVLPCSILVLLPYSSSSRLQRQSPHSVPEEAW